MQVPRHKKNIFKNSLEMYLVIMVMEEALRCKLASHYNLNLRSWNAGVVRFWILDCGIWILFRSSSVLSVFQSPILNPSSKISVQSPEF